MLDTDKQDVPRASVEPALGRKGVGTRAKAPRLIFLLECVMVLKYACTFFVTLFSKDGV